MIADESNALIAQHLVLTLHGFLAGDTEANLPSIKEIWQYPECATALKNLLIIHGLPAIYDSALKKTGNFSQLPDEFKTFLKQAVAAQWTTQAKLAALQDEVGRIFKECSMPFFVLKGLALSERLYGNAFMRASGDVDILVRRKDLDAARVALLEHGLEISRSSQGRFHETLVSKKYKSELELHWGLADRRFTFDAEELIARGLNAPKMRLSGEEFYAMEPTDELLYLAHHHAGHYLLVRWLWLMDVAVFLKKYGLAIDWNLLRERTEKYRLNHSVGLSLLYVQLFFGDLYENKMRENLERFLKDVKVPLLSQGILLFLADPRMPFSCRCSRSLFQRRLFGFLLASGPLRRLSSILRR